MQLAETLSVPSSNHFTCRSAGLLVFEMSQLTFFTFV